MHRNVSISLLLLAALIAPELSLAQDRLSAADSAAIVSLIDRVTSTARRAWEARDATILVPDTSSTEVRTPQGQIIRAADMRADVQRRMNMTTRVDTLREVLDSIRVLRRDSVVAFTTQTFVRVIQLPDGPARQRHSTVIHARPLVLRSEEWVLSGPLTEINPRAWWAGEQPPR